MPSDRSRNVRPLKSFESQNWSTSALNAFFQLRHWPVEFGSEKDAHCYGSSMFVWPLCSV